MNTEIPTTRQEQLQVITKDGVLLSEIFLRTMRVFIIYFLIALFSGIAFIIIEIGVFLFVLWFFLYLQPAYAIFIKAINLPHAPQKLIRVPIPIYQFPFLAAKFLLSTYAIYTGIMLLITNGFCSQNFFC